MNVWKRARDLLLAYAAVAVVVSCLLLIEFARLDQEAIIGAVLGGLLWPLTAYVVLVHL